MDQALCSLFGLIDSEKRLYRFSDGQVEREEFEFCQTINTLLFGDKGIVDTLGPTWNLVHDPRFQAMESCFVVNRKAVFGGDARKGVSTVTGANGELLASSLADLEQYSEILGEGRVWLDICKSESIHPNDLKNFAGGTIWQLIRNNWPNYFAKNGVANKEANRLFNLVRMDLVGLIADYAAIAHVQEWRHMETGELVDSITDMSIPMVYVEVEDLDRALNFRATLRATAVRILSQVGITDKLTSMHVELTDFEADKLLRLVYENDLWPDNKAELCSRAFMFILGCSRLPLQERLYNQLADLRKDSQIVIEKLRSGQLKPITRHTDPGIEMPMDDAAKVVYEIQQNPLKASLFTALAEAERRGLTDVVALISPVFDKPGYDLTEEGYVSFMEQAHKLGYESSNIQVVEGSN